MVSQFKKAVEYDNILALINMKEKESDLIFIVLWMISERNDYNDGYCALL